MGAGAASARELDAVAARISDWAERQLKAGGMLVAVDHDPEARRWYARMRGDEKAAIAYAYGPGMDPAWELSCSMAVSDRMVLLVRALAVFAVNAVLGLAASAVSAVPAVSASGAAAAVTFGWLIPMTAVCAFALAVATVARSASAGAAAGIGAWLITVLCGQAASGHFAAAVSDTVLFLPYLAIGAVCAAVALYATRIPRGTL